MTSREAMAGLREIQARHGKTFLLDDLTRIWPELLQHSAACFVHVVGRIVKGSKFFPKADYVLDLLQKMDRARGASRRPIDKEKEAQASFRLMKIGDVEERVSALYWMADNTLKAGYAVAAAQLEQKILPKTEPKVSGNNLEKTATN